MWVSNKTIIIIILLVKKKKYYYYRRRISQYGKIKLALWKKN